MDNYISKHAFLGNKDFYRSRSFAKLSSKINSTSLLVSAPAGYGKSTFIKNWLKNQSVQWDWLNLDGYDNDIDTFIHRLITVIQKNANSLEPAKIDSIAFSKNKSIAELSKKFLSVINELDNEQIIVLDNYEHISNEDISKFIESTIAHLPANVRFILISRTKLNFPIDDWKSAGKINCLETADFILDFEETEAFIKELYTQELDWNSMNFIQKKTEGWIMGIKLLAESSKNFKNIKLLEDSESYHIDNYFLYEVINKQTEFIKSVLFVTALFDKFSNSMIQKIIDQVLNEKNGYDKDNNYLENIQQNNLFGNSITSFPCSHHLEGTRLTSSRLWISLAVLVAAAPSAHSQQNTPAPDLFRQVPVNQITRFHDDPAAIRQDNVYLNRELFVGEAFGTGTAPRVTLNLFPDVRFEATYRDIELAYGGGYVVRYDIDNEGWDYAAFAVTNDAVSGIVHVDDRIFTIGNVGDGELTVSEVDPGLYEPCGVNVSHKVDASRQGGAGGGRASGHTSHVLIVYTTNVTTAEGGHDGVNTLANLAMSEMNRALAQGDSTFRVNLVHTYETSYTQSGSQGTDLGRLRDTSDGYMDEVHGFRDAYGADFVELFIANYGSGVAYVNCDGTSAWENNAFSVGKNTRVAATYTLAHEIGHNMGLQHDRANAGSTCSTPYCFGWETANPTGTTYGSVMSYPGSRRPIYSNPDIDAPNGWPMGVANSEDNSRHIGGWYTSFVAFRGGVSWYHQVKTTFDGGNGSGGNMFDIRPKTDLSLTGIAINTRIIAGSTATVDVWFRDGSWVGFDGSSTGWTFLQTLSGTSAGENSPTVLNFSGSVQDRIFQGGETYGFYVEATNGINGDFRYTNGADSYEDSFVRIESGCGKAFGGFGSSTFNDRIWNGILYYDGAWGAHYLATTLASNVNTFNGNMFDLEVYEDITISSFDVNVNTVAGIVTGVDVWYRNGTYVGSENNPDGWIFAGTDTKAVSAGPDAYTTITIGDIDLNAGSTYGFYIRSSGGDTIRYTTGSSEYFNSDLKIISGVGLGGSNPFGTVASGRTWNGQIRYRSTAGTPHLELENFVAGGLAYFSVSNCTPGGTVQTAYSTAGGGPLSTPWGTAYLTLPVTYLPTMSCDAVGEGSLWVAIPAGATGVNVWFQSLDDGSGTLTNGVAATVQ